MSASACAAMLAEDPALRTRVLALQGRLQLLRQVQDRALANWLSAEVEVRPDGDIASAICRCRRASGESGRSPP
jgi:hypothetical protein